MPSSDTKCERCQHPTDRAALVATPNGLRCGMCHYGRWPVVQVTKFQAAEVQMLCFDVAETDDRPTWGRLDGRKLTVWSFDAATDDLANLADIWGDKAEDDPQRCRAGAESIAGLYNTVQGMARPDAKPHTCDPDPTRTHRWHDPSGKRFLCCSACGHLEPWTGSERMPAHPYAGGRCEHFDSLAAFKLAPTTDANDQVATDPTPETDASSRPGGHILTCGCDSRAARHVRRCEYAGQPIPRATDAPVIYGGAGGSDAWTALVDPSAVPKRNGPAPEVPWQDRWTTGPVGSSTRDSAALDEIAAILRRPDTSAADDIDAIAAVMNLTGREV